MSLPVRSLPGEYMVAGVVVIVCVVSGDCVRGDWLVHARLVGGFFPFFYDWHQLYQEGLINAAEWKANRFRWL